MLAEISVGLAVFAGVVVALGRRMSGTCKRRHTVACVRRCVNFLNIGFGRELWVLLHVPGLILIGAGIQFMRIVIVGMKG